MSSRNEAQVLIAGLLFLAVALIFGVTANSSLPWRDGNSTHHRITSEETLQVSLEVGAIVPVDALPGSMEVRRVQTWRDGIVGDSEVAGDPHPL
jgi:hypothetical protein